MGTWQTLYHSYRHVAVTRPRRGRWRDVSSDDTARAATALADLRKGLQADGYDLKVETFDDARLHVGILALDGACEDCLVPSHVMEVMIKAAVPSAEHVELTYP